MQAVILAAGLAKRLRPLTDTMPKCLLKIGNKNLLHRTLENVIQNGISNIIFVTGYKEEMIINYIKNNFPDLNITFITNSDYENNNNSYSLWMTKNYIIDSFILMDSDILFDTAIIKKLLESEFENAAAVNITGKLDSEQIKVVIDDNNKILAISKEVDIEKAAGESIGIEKFSKSYADEIFKILDRKILIEKNVNEFYEKTFEEIISKNDIRNSLYCVDVSEYECIEIDTIEDYYKANNEFKKI